MERKYLSGNIRERLQDLMKERKITQSELAAKIGMDVSTLSRFISNATGKLGDENIKKIAKEFEVSTDFLLGVTDIPDRMNYDIAELGLSVQAAKNLYTGKVNAEVVNRLLENKNFAAMTNMIAHYFDDTLAAGYAAQNQMYATLSALLMGEAKQHPEDREAITEAAKTVSVSRMPMYQADLTAIQNTFMNVLKEIKKEIGSNVSDAQAMSKEAAQHMYAELTKGQDVTKPNRDAAHPYWKPRAKGFHPFGYPHHFLTNGTHIEKTAFYHVGPFLENATAHDIHFCRGFAKISTCAVGCRAKIPCLPTQKISSSRCCGRKTIADFLLIVPGLLSQKYFSKNSNKSVVNSV